MLRKLMVTSCLCWSGLVTPLPGQDLPFWVDSVQVTLPSPGGIGAVTLAGDWIDTCVPDAVSQTRAGSVIDLEVTQPGLGVGCGDAITPWSLTEEFGPLPPGEFQVRGTLVAVNPNDRDVRETISGPDLLFSSITVPQGRFSGLGNPSGDAYVSRAFDVSADGRVVVGHNELAPGAAGLITREAFAWSPDTGMFPIGRLPGATTGGSTGRGVSGNGNVVVGDSDRDFGPEAFRWTLGGGMEGLGGLIEPSHSTAAAASHDGTIVVGGSEFFPPSHKDPPVPAVIREAFRWTPDRGMLGLGQVHVGGTSWATDVSARGRVVVGNATLDPLIEIAYPDISEPFRWTHEEGMVGLGQFPHPILPLVDFGFPVQLETTAEAVSAEGDHIVGTGRVVHGITGEVVWGRAYRWTSEEGFVDLGEPPTCVLCSSLDAGALGAPDGNTPSDSLLPAGEFDLKAVDVSADGSTIVGVGKFVETDTFPTDDPDGARPRGFIPGFGEEFSFLWQENRGMRLLEDVLLTDYGFDVTGQLDGWELGTVSAISDDGTTIVGTGINPQGQQEAWRVVLGRTTIPGDADFDGDVDRDDAAIVLTGLGTTDGAAFVDGDFDFNGAVDGNDVMTLLLGFGSTRATFQPAGESTAAVPEPATLLLLGLGAFLFASCTFHGRAWA